MKQVVIVCMVILLGIAAGLYIRSLKQASPEMSVEVTPTAAATQSEPDRAVARAKEVYTELKEKGTDFTAGPCIAEDLMLDWVADVAHDPRQPVDDNPENQCASYREGKAHHFVELDPEGNFIRAY